MISADRQAQILRYYHVEKWRINTIAVQLGVHHTTVQRVLAQAGLQRAAVNARASAVDAFVPMIVQTLERFPTPTAARLYVMARERGYAGSAGHFRHRVALLRPRRPGDCQARACQHKPRRPATTSTKLRKPRNIASSFSNREKLGAKVLRERGEEIDYAAPGIFDRLAEAVIEAVPSLRATVDLLVIDEGQDFEPPWAAALLQFVRPEGRCLWLEDPSQNLYRREPVSLAGWAVLHSPVNFRSPHVLVTLSNVLGLTDEPMQAGGTVHGFDPQLHQYCDEESLFKATDTAVRAFLDEGHASAAIAVLNWHGRERSRVIHAERVAEQHTRRFTGHYTQADRTDGMVRIMTRRIPVFRRRCRSSAAHRDSPTDGSPAPAVPPAG